MILDCVLFNDELDMLELRLTYMYPHVDQIVIAESTLTHTDRTKPLYFKDNFARFLRFSDKIIHVVIPPIEQHDSWKGEYYQRDYIRTALKNCSDDDVIIISDIDEIVNIEYLKTDYIFNKPYVLNTPMYCYFFNLKTSFRWQRVLITPYQFIKNFNIGNRIEYQNLEPRIIGSGKQEPGWHFTYLFGLDVSLYKSKLVSFSHQEYNSVYFLNDNRIKTCVSLGVDFLERYMIYKPIDLFNELPISLTNAIKSVYNIKDFLFKKPGMLFYIIPYHIKYHLKFITKLKLSILLSKLRKPINA